MTLRVTPQITEGETLRLDIFQEITARQRRHSQAGVGDPNQVGVALSNRKVENTVVVTDGETVVIGGLISDDYSDTVDQGARGSATSRSSAGSSRPPRPSCTKRNLLVFLTPHIDAHLERSRAADDPQARGVPRAARSRRSSSSDESREPDELDEADRRARRPAHREGPEPRRGRGSRRSIARYPARAHARDRARRRAVARARAREAAAQTDRARALPRARRRVRATQASRNPRSHELSTPATTARWSPSTVQRSRAATSCALGPFVDLTRPRNAPPRPCAAAMPWRPR